MFIPLDATLSLEEKKSQPLSPKHPQSLWKIWSPSRSLNSFNSKEKAGSPSWLVDLLWPWAFHQLLEYVVIITCTLSALSPGLCPGRTIHHNHIILYRLLLGGMRLLELILPLTGADRNGGLQMGRAERWCSASASSAFSRQNLRPLRRELDLCSPPSCRTRQWAHSIYIPSGVSYQLPTSAQGVGWYWAGAGNARSEVANCLMHDVIAVLVIAVVQNRVKAPGLLAIAFPGAPSPSVPRCSFLCFLTREATEPTPTSYLCTWDLDAFHPEIFLPSLSLHLLLAPTENDAVCLFNRIFLLESK